MRCKGDIIMIQIFLIGMIFLYVFLYKVAKEREEEEGEREDNE